jgi:DNA-binding transcriptional MocR family regulator
MLICNPTNPHGRTHSRRTLLDYCLFAEKHDLHLVSDEIYGLSVYDNPAYRDALPFTSMLSLDVEKETGVKFDKSRLHVVHGMSKDFCSNGLRLGVLVTPHNPRLIRTMAQTSMLMKVSSPADVLLSALLTSPTSPTASSATFLDWFIKENRRRLTVAHALVRSWFERRGVRVADSNAGHFCWVQLGERMGWTTLADEKQGFQQLLDGGVYLGQSLPLPLYKEAQLLTLGSTSGSSWLGLQRAPAGLDARHLCGRSQRVAPGPHPGRGDPRPPARLCLSAREVGRDRWKGASAASRSPEPGIS